MKKVNILFIHPLTGNAYEIYKAFNRLEEVNIHSLINIEKELPYTFIDKIRYKCKLHRDIYNINKNLLNYNLSNTDIIFIIKGNEIYPNTIKNIKENHPHIKFISFSLDDMYAWHNRSLFYTFGLKYYDLVVTTKSYNVKELLSIGAKRVMFTYQAFSKDIHKPIYDNNYNHDILFIGFPEKERINSILHLANNGIKVNIYGYPTAWEKYTINHPNIINHKKSLEKTDYAKAISSSKITLCFLRKINRDLHTSRSIEIPACKGFMVAERTIEHLDLFEENKEAVYFDDDKELLEKVTYYLENKEERERIQENGYRKCLDIDYSYDNMVKKIINEINIKGDS